MIMNMWTKIKRPSSSYPSSRKTIAACVRTEGGYSSQTLVKVAFNCLSYCGPILLLL